MKYFILPLIFFLTSCSLDKNSTYWKDETVNKSVEKKKILKELKENPDLKKMTFDEFDIFLKDYSDKSSYPDINK